MDTACIKHHCSYAYSLLSSYTIKHIAVICLFLTALTSVLRWEKETRLESILAQPPPFERENDSNQSTSLWTPDTIHLCMTVNGLIVSQRMLNTIRSILYYQNRVIRDRPECLIRILNATILSCPENLAKKYLRPIHFHIITNKHTQGIVHKNLVQWALERVTWSFYSMDDNIYKVKWVSNYHSAGLSAMIKLVIPNMLPETVEKVITIDTDVLFNHDITELWDHFQKFNEKQMLGFAWEQQSNHPDCKENLVTIIPKAGINAGLALFHLKRMRQMNWENLWHIIERIEHFQHGYLGEGEQVNYQLNAMTHT
ncbi:hypothetical protein D915_004502 [Fasciola hepatica]|uniref:Uncharacterized protein n=1 Tax=Fasciola hepatica TaxID=6192 RepID=A0A4E0RE78_FASHE|nr:hypothetical protein D915_004502 [Fasciola hepatica]